MFDSDPSFKSQENLEKEPPSFRGPSKKIIENAVGLARKFSMPFGVGLYLLTTGCKQKNDIENWADSFPDDTTEFVVPPQIAKDLDTLYKDIPPPVIMAVHDQYVNADKFVSVKNNETEIPGDSIESSLNTSTVSNVPSIEVNEVSALAGNQIVIPIPMSEPVLPAILMSTIIKPITESSNGLEVEGGISLKDKKMGFDAGVSFPFVFGDKTFIANIGIEKEPGSGPNETKVSGSIAIPFEYKTIQLQAGTSMTLNFQGQHRYSVSLGTPEDSEKTITGGIIYTPNFSSTFTEKVPVIIGNVGVQVTHNIKTEAGIGEHGMYMGAGINMGKVNLNLTVVAPNNENKKSLLIIGASYKF